MGDKRNARKPKVQRATAQTRMAVTPSRPLSTRKRKLSAKAAANNAGRKKLVYSQLEDEGVSQDVIAEDILADLGATPEKNEAVRYVPSHSSKNGWQEYDDDFEEEEEAYEEIVLESDGDDDFEQEEDDPGPRIKDKRKKPNTLARSGVLAILFTKGLTNDQ
jgi:hypothetical protein